VFTSYGRGSSSELFQSVDRFLIPTPLRNPHPTGSAKGCRGAARDILVVDLAGHNRVRPGDKTAVVTVEGSRVSATKEGTPGAKQNKGHVTGVF